MPMGGNEMPPMGIEGGSEEFNMNPENDVNQEMGDIPNTGMPTEFGGNFDAGVEADEETDPKKFIQQLTGKLSQSLNSYNNENGEPDTELGKYVLGMLVKQGTKGMDDKDKKEIIKKINSNESEDEDLSDEEMNVEEPTDDENIEMNEMPMESKTFKFTKRQLFENFGVVMNDENIPTKKMKNDAKITPDTIRNRRTRPFEAPKKFKE